MRAAGLALTVLYAKDRRRDRVEQMAGTSNCEKCVRGKRIAPGENWRGPDRLALCSQQSEMRSSVSVMMASGEGFRKVFGTVRPRQEFSRVACRQKRPRRRLLEIENIVTTAMSSSSPGRRSRADPRRARRCVYRRLRVGFEMTNHGDLVPRRAVVCSTIKGVR